MRCSMTSLVTWPNKSSQHVNYTLLHIQVKKHQTAAFIFHAITICVPTTNIYHVQPIRSHTHISQIGQYIYLIYTAFNQPCQNKYCYTYILQQWHSPWANIPATLHMNVPLHITSTRLHIQVKESSQYAELSSTRHTYHVFGHHIYSLLSITTILFSEFMPITWETCAHMCIMPMKFWKPQIFYICKPYFLFHIYDSFSIPCLPAIFFSK